MKYKLSKHRITLLIVLFPLAVLIVYGLMSYLLFSNIRQKDILQEVKSYGQSIYVNEKERLKEKVQILSDSINAYDQLKREKINQNLVMTLDTTAEFVNHLYRFRRGKTSSSAIQKEILKKKENPEMEGILTMSQKEADRITIVSQIEGNKLTN